MTEPKQNADDAYAELLGNLEDANKALTRLTLSLGHWYASSWDNHLYPIILEAGGLEAIAYRIRQVAEERVREP